MYFFTYILLLNFYLLRHCQIIKLINNKNKLVLKRENKSIIRGIKLIDYLILVNINIKLIMQFTN